MHAWIDDNALLAAALFLLFALVMLVLMVAWILRQDRRDNPWGDPEASNRFRIPFLIVFTLGAFTLAGSVDKAADAIEAGRRAPAATPHRSEYDLRHCSPSGVELSPIVRFTIRTSADGGPEIVGCTRYAVTPRLKRGAHQVAAR